MKKSYVYAGVALLGLGMFLGGIIANIIFFGFLTAGSLVILVQTAGRAFRLMFAKYAFLVDLVLFILSALAVATLGVTVAGGLGVASLLFTLYRVMYLKPWFEKNNTKSEKAGTLVGWLAKQFNSVVRNVKSLFVKSDKSVA